MPDSEGPFKTRAAPLSGLRLSRFSRILLIPIIGLFVLAAGYTSTLIRERQDALQQVSRYNVTWLVSQAVAELSRLQQRIAATAVPDSGIDKDEVHLRLDIVESR